MQNDSGQAGSTSTRLLDKLRDLMDGDIQKKVLEFAAQTARFDEKFPKIEVDRRMLEFAEECASFQKLLPKFTPPNLDTFGPVGRLPFPASFQPPVAPSRSAEREADHLRTTADRFKQGLGEGLETGVRLLIDGRDAGMIRLSSIGFSGTDFIVFRGTRDESALPVELLVRVGQLAVEFCALTKPAKREPPSRLGFSKECADAASKAP